jgi:ribosomal protein S18 acetylase RimI-like enzyme
MSRSPEVQVTRLGEADAERVHAAAHLFDDAPDAEATELFLHDPRHHLLIAYVDQEPAGFVSGVEIIQPDKGVEMMLYEIGVDDPYRRRGIGRDLVRHLAALAWERDCAALFVLTEHDNVAALAMYAFDDAEREDGVVSFTWRRPDDEGGIAARPRRA